MQMHFWDPYVTMPSPLCHDTPEYGESPYWQPVVKRTHFYTRVNIIQHWPVWWARIVSLAKPCVTYFTVLVGQRQLLFTTITQWRVAKGIPSVISLSARYFQHLTRRLYTKASIKRPTTSMTTGIYLNLCPNLPGVSIFSASVPLPWKIISWA